jgi:hypothetical protein
VLPVKKDSVGRAQGSSHKNDKAKAYKAKQGVVFGWVFFKVRGRAMLNKVSRLVCQVYIASFVVLSQLYYFCDFLMLFAMSGTVWCKAGALHGFLFAGAYALSWATCSVAC